MGFLDKALGWAPVIGTALDAYNQHQANQSNKKIAREQMKFQERMSNTEIQRRVNDFTDAGMNPMLAAINQQGASSAQGASTRVEPITRNTASSALAVTMQRQQLENMDAQTKLLLAQRRNVEEDTVLKSTSALNLNTQTNKLEYETMNLAQQWRQMQTNLDISVEDLRSRRLNNEQLEKMQPLLEKAQQIANELDRLKIPEAQVTAEWFQSMLGGGSRYAGAAKDMLQIIQMLRNTR